MAALVAPSLAAISTIASTNSNTLGDIQTSYDSASASVADLAISGPAPALSNLARKTNSLSTANHLSSSSTLPNPSLPFPVLESVGAPSLLGGGGIESVPRSHTSYHNSVGEGLSSHPSLSSLPLVHHNSDLTTSDSNQPSPSIDQGGFNPLSHQSPATQSTYTFGMNYTRPSLPQVGTLHDGNGNSPSRSPGRSGSGSGSGSTGSINTLAGSQFGRQASFGQPSSFSSPISAASTSPTDLGDRHSEPLPYGGLPAPPPPPQPHPSAFEHPAFGHHLGGGSGQGPLVPAGGPGPRSDSMTPNHPDFQQSFYDPFHRIKHRRRTSPAQLKVLEAHFELNSKPDLNLRKQLSEELGMTAREVQVWFQNRRAKCKKLEKRMVSQSDVSRRRKSEASSDEFATGGMGSNDDGSPEGHEEGEEGDLPDRYRQQLDNDAMLRRGSSPAVLGYRHTPGTLGGGHMLQGPPPSQGPMPGGNIGGWMQNFGQQGMPGPSMQDPSMLHRPGPGQGQEEIPAFAFPSRQPIPDGLRISVPRPNANTNFAIGGGGGAGGQPSHFPPAQQSSTASSVAGDSNAGSMDGFITPTISSGSVASSVASSGNITTPLPPAFDQSRRASYPSDFINSFNNFSFGQMPGHQAAMPPPPSWQPIAPHTQPPPGLHGLPGPFAQQQQQQQQAQQHSRRHSVAVPSSHDIALGTPTQASMWHQQPPAGSHHQSYYQQLPMNNVGNAPMPHHLPGIAMDAYGRRASTSVLLDTIAEAPLNLNPASMAMDPSGRHTALSSTQPSPDPNNLAQIDRDMARSASLKDLQNADMSRASSYSSLSHVNGNLSRKQSAATLDSFFSGTEGQGGTPS